MLPPASRHAPPQARFPVASASPREQTRPSLHRGGSDLTPRGPAESRAEGSWPASSPQGRALARPLMRGTGGGREGFHVLPSPPGGPGSTGGRGTEFTAHPHCPARLGLSIRHARPSWRSSPGRLSPAPRVTQLTLYRSPEGREACPILQRSKQAQRRRVWEQGVRGGPGLWSVYSRTSHRKHSGGLRALEPRFPHP